VTGSERRRVLQKCYSVREKTSADSPWELHVPGRQSWEKASPSETPGPGSSGAGGS